MVQLAGHKLAFICLTLTDIKYWQEALIRPFAYLINLILLPAMVTNQDLLFLLELFNGLALLPPHRSELPYPPLEVPVLLAQLVQVVGEGADLVLLRCQTLERAAVIVVVDDVVDLVLDAGVVHHQVLVGSLHGAADVLAASRLAQARVVGSGGLLLLLPMPLEPLVFLHES